MTATELISALQNIINADPAAADLPVKLTIHGYGAISIDEVAIVDGGSGHRIDIS